MGASEKKRIRERSKLPMGECRGCGKQMFESRKAAREWARRVHGRQGHMSGYECEHNPGVYHYGHLPTVVSRGVTDRSQVTATPRLV